MPRRLLDGGYTAGQTLFKNNVGALVNGFIYNYDPTNTLHHGKVIGFIKDDHVFGDSVIIIRDGYIDMPSLVLGDIYYADVNGSITNIIPVTEPIVKVGIAKNNTELIIQFSDTSLSGLTDNNNYFP